jgi:hypothetical protein
VITGGIFRTKGEDKICTKNFSRSRRYQHDKSGTKAQVGYDCQHLYCRISHLAKCEMTTRYYLERLVHVTLNMLIRRR